LSVGPSTGEELCAGGYVQGPLLPAPTSSPRTGPILSNSTHRR